MIKFKRLTSSAIMPTRGSDQAAGIDLYADCEATIRPGGRKLIGTGVAMSVASWLHGQIWPRSGLATKRGIHVGAGIVDSDYRGEIGVLLFNFGEEDFRVEPGDRIAQLVITERCSHDIVERVDLDDTARGSGGFGSTGR